MNAETWNFGKPAKKRRVRPLVSGLVVLAVVIGQAALMGPVSAANPAANLDQCANDPLPSSHLDGCNSSSAQWVNGNLGASKSVYFEGDSIPYRMRFSSLPLVTHTVTIQWDTTKSGKHALDYLTTFNQSVANANPCLGVTGCNPLSFNTAPIPADPQVTGAGVTPIAGNFRLYGGTITNVGAYSYPDGTGFTGDKSAQLAITFTASVANPVLAWGGHISTRADWGANGSAVAISGSPYHTRLIDLDGAGGNQDRSLSADAVIFPGSITIIKDTVPDDSHSFGFTDTGGLSPTSFSLVDDGTNTNNSRTFGNITNFTTYTVIEGSAPNYTLSFQTPVCTVTSPNSGTQSGNTTTRTVTINLKEGENVTCTFVNTHTNNTPTISTLLSDSSIVVGESVTDSATLSGATTGAGGTVKYRVYANTTTCNADTDGSGGSSAGTVTVTNGVVPDSDPVTFNSVGTFYFRAFYSGDGNNDPASSGCLEEVVTVGPASPGITTTATATATVGDNINDTAHLTGLVNPDGTGTVTFTAFSAADCNALSQVFTSGSTPTFVTANGDYTSGDYTTTAVGTIYWIASFSGDGNNSGATTACGDDNESSVVGPASPGITTTATATATVGDNINDTAHLTGLVNPDGTGTVTFTAFSAADCNALSQVFTSGSTPTFVTANGDYTSGDYTTTAVGTIYWIASFSGDGNNSGATTACGDDNESSVVGPASPGITTTATATATVGDNINDTAHLTGLVNPDGTGTVTFTAFSAADCNALSQVFTSGSTPTFVTANGDYTSGDYTTTAVGTIYWIASFSGDGNNSGATTACGDDNESSVVGPASPGITTTATATATVGDNINDTAHLTGLVNPDGTGTVTFTAFSAADCNALSQVFTSGSTPTFVTANGDYTSGDYTTTAVGTIYWIASFSGDGNNSGATTACGDDNESSVVGPASPGITTTATATATVGDNINDTAHLTGLVNPDGTGTVTFTAFSAADCNALSQVFTSGSTPTFVTANGDYTSGDYTTTAVGTIYWIASFSGDGNNSGATTACGDDNESSVVGPASPGITTTATATATVGDNINDTAHLTGLVNPDGTGTVTFTAFSAADCNALSQVFTSGSTPTFVTANGDYTSGDYTTTAVGTIYWIASFSGDGNNSGATTACGDDNESSVVGPASPGITTTATATATVGDNINDTAHLTGLVNPDGTGTVTFTAFSAADCNALSQVFTSGSTPTFVTANGDYTSGDYTTTAVGTIYWIASFSGDGNNSGATTACGDDNESSVVGPASPGITTTATATATVGDNINDTAHLTGLVNPDGTGTVTFTAFSAADCNALSQVFTSGSTPTFVTANGDYTSGDYTTTAVGTIYWIASFSGDGNNSGATTACGDDNESSVVGPASPGITTTATATATVGDNINDTAHLTGLVNPDGTGTVTFTAFSAADCNALSQVFTSGSTPTFVTANGDYTSGDYTTTAVGTIYWIASFSGDGNNSGATTACGDDNESSVVGPASPGITTTATATATVGDNINDTAHLTGLVNPDGTGTVTFTAFSAADCNALSQVFTSGSTPTFVTANGDYTSGDYTTTAVGTIYWIASFSGDGNNSGATTACGDDNESSVVTAPPPVSQITPTATTCDQFSHGTAATLDTVNYKVANGKISQVDPGVFFYWVAVTATSGQNTFTIDQTITTGNFSTFFTVASGSAAFNSSCTKVNTTIASTSTPGQITVKFSGGTTGGTFFIGIKYSTGSVKGANAPSPTTVHYDFSTEGVAGSTSGLNLKKKV